MQLRRMTAFLLCLCLLCLPVRGVQPEKLVALTFDDGPSGRFTRRLLDGLAQRNAEATFFLCGYRMAQYPELTERIHREGHEIGVHGYSHKSMAAMSRTEADREIERTLALIPKDCTVTFLRTPGGQCGDCSREAAAARRLAVLCWSVDPRDWADRDPAAITEYVVSRVRDGDVILLHDMSDSSVDAALAIVDQLQAKGFRFVTASALAEAMGVAPAAGRTYTRFAPGTCLK